MREPSTYHTPSAVPFIIAASIGITIAIVATSIVRASPIAAPPAPKPKRATSDSFSSPIVGGSTVARGTWPDAVAVLGQEGMCTGTLIAADVVLTAGHCIDIIPELVIVNSIDFNAPDGERVPVKWSRAYPSWWERYDVGVIMLDHPVFTKPRPIAAACTIRDHLILGERVHLVGFGLTTSAGTGTNSRLHAAIAPIIDPTCARDPACAAEIAPGGEFAAGGHGADSCFGDSGGPVYVDTSHGPALLGVTSRGAPHGDIVCGGGGIYVRADKVVAWIQRVTGRKLVRAACDRPADDSGDDDDDEATAGCSAGDPGCGAGALLGLAAALWLLTRPRRDRDGAQ